MLLFAMALILKGMNLRYIISVITSLLIFCSPSDGSGIGPFTVQNSPSYINISWAIAAGLSWDYYTVDVIKISLRSVSGYPTNTTDTTHLITGLKPEQQYTIVVTPWTTEGAGPSLNTIVTTEAIAEGEILVSDVTSSSAFIQWRPVAGVFFYDMEAEPSGAIAGTGGIFEPEVGLTILLPGTVFNVTVRGGNVDLASTQIRSAPESPVNVSVKQTGTTEATLSWTPPTSPHDAYEFYVINNSTNERSRITTEQRDDVSDNEVTLTGLSPATIYSFEVGSVLNAMDSFGLQRSGQDDNPTVYGRTAPESPVNVSLKQTGTTEATLSLTPPTSPHDAYEFYVINNSTNERSLITTKQRDDDSDNEVTLTGLSPATIYSFEVGSVLNAMDSFGLQRSGQDDNPTVYGRTGVRARNSYIIIGVVCALLITGVVLVVLVVIYRSRRKGRKELHSPPATDDPKVAMSNVTSVKSADSAPTPFLAHEKENTYASDPTSSHTYIQE